MSIRIMSEFFGLQLGSANRKMVALRLADFADDSGRGMWPTVERVAEECELSIRTVQRVLEQFVAEGMLVVVRKGGGGPGSSTRYDFDMARVRARAAEIAAGGAGGADKGDSVSPLDKGDSGDAKGDSHDQKGCHGVTRSIREPSDPSLERERAQAGGEETETAPAAPEGLTRRAEALFWKSFKAWDRFDVSPKQPMLAAWARLTWDEMQAAADAVPRFLAAKKGAGMRHACAVSTYLDPAERLWQAFPPEPEKPADPVAPPFGPLWGAVRARALLAAPGPLPKPGAFAERIMAQDDAAGRAERLAHQARHGWPAVNRMHEAAESARGVVVAAALEPLKGLCEQVKVGGEIWQAWQAEHVRRGWPWLPDPGRQEWVYFPKGGPKGLHAFEQAMRTGHDAGERQAAE